MKYIIRGFMMIKTKLIPDINFSKVKENYAKFLACGYDSIQESFNLTITAEWAEKLLYMKNQVEQSNTPESFMLVEPLQLAASGASGFTYRLENDDFQILIRNPAGKIREWQVSVRYLSGGLWEHGYNLLKERVVKVLMKLCYAPNSEDWQRITRCDFCFDFYSPEFGKEMTPEICSGIVGTNKVKQQICGATSFEDTEVGFSGWIKAGRVETLTIGSKANMQVSIYDKTREIKEASGKTWFYKIWGTEYRQDVFRLEIRMSKEWLRNREIKTMQEIEENREYLVNEALIRRRLAIPGADSNRSRWRLHPLWVLAYQINGSQHEVLQIGRQTTKKRQELKEMCIKQAAGCIRSAVILEAKEWDEESFVITARDVYQELFNDPKRHEKERRTIERYKFTGEAA